LKLEKTEAIGRETENPKPDGDCDILDYVNKHQKDSFEAIVGVIILVGIVLHVTIKVDNKPNYHQNPKYNEER
jgi:hypothetical protein